MSKVKNVNANTRKGTSAKTITKDSNVADTLEQVQSEKIKEKIKISFANMNLESVAPKTNNGANKQVGKYRYYENENVESSTRQKFRKTLSRLIDNILFSANEFQKVENEVNENLFFDSVKAFNKEYKYRYLVNDFGVESLLNSNATPNFINRVKMALNCIKTNNLQTLL